MCAKEGRREGLVLPGDSLQDKGLKDNTPIFYLSLKTLVL